MKNIKKMTVSIGIPAYNEEANIKQLLSSLLLQKEMGFVLESIIVTSDKSTDDTEKEVRSIKSKKINLIVNKVRLGQAVSQNTIIKKNTSDILIILNADILIKDKFFIKKMIEPIMQNKKIGIVSPKVVPLPAKNFFERVINYSVSIKYEGLYMKLNNGNNIYMCHGRARAFSKDFLKKLHFKKVWSEDAFSYLVCLKYNFLFQYQPKTEVYYKSPINFKDHRLQSGRFLKSMTEVSKYFDANFIKSEYTLPFQYVVFSGVRYFFINPVYFVAYGAMLLAIRFFGQVQLTSMWEIATSSKKLTTEKENVLV